MAGAATMALAPPEGRRIAVMGVCGGIGRALATALSQAGCEVVGLDRPAAFDTSPPPPCTTHVAVDATDTEALAKAFADIGPLDGLANLAGFSGTRTAVAETDPALWHEVVEGNLSSAFLVARSAIPCLLRGTDPSVVMVSSGLAAKAVPGYGPYAAAKAAVLSLTRVLAAEVAPDVRVNAVAPSAVETAFLMGGTGRPQRAIGFDREAYIANVPLARMAVAEDIVGPILFLLGPASAYMTGQTLHVNGGLITP
ncbi:MAG: SDR family NAD(P)-dependent oxidoreductase [Pseudomonadota bacterium]